METLMIILFVLVFLTLGFNVYEGIKSRNIRNNIVEIRDKKPENKKDYGITLSNEIKPFIKEDGDEIYLNIYVKEK